MMYSHLATFWIYVLFVYMKFKKVPYYLKQFYEETTLHWSWRALPGAIKQKWLDYDLSRYMNKRKSKQQ